MFKNTSILVVVLLFTARPVTAEDALFEVSKWSFKAGIFDTKADTSMRVNGSGGLIGTELDVEDFLNVQEDKRTGFLAARYSFWDKHFVEAEYINIGRKGRRTLNQSFNFDGTTFDVGANIASSITTEVYRIGYGYQLIQKENFVLAASLGVHITSFKAEIDARITAGGGGIQGAGEFADVTAPLPVFGVSGAWKFGEKWALVGRGQLLRIEIDDIDGALSHASIALEHDTFEHIGFGIGYDFFDVDVSASNSDWNGEVDFRFEGPMVFVKAIF